MFNSYSLSEAAKTAIHIAQSIARENHHETFSPSHLLKALLHKDIGLTPFVESMGKDVHYLNDWLDVRIEDSPRSGKAIENPIGDSKIPTLFDDADMVRIKLGLHEINPICLLTSASKPGIAFSVDQLKSFPIREKEIYDIYLSDYKIDSAISGEAGSVNTSAPGKLKSSGALLKFCVDKTAQAREGKLDPIIGRDSELRMMLEILCRRSKPNVMIVGEPGVGKSALIDGFAKQIVDQLVPDMLKEAILFELDLGALMAGATYKGEVEDRLKSIITELKQFDKAILFIDEIHVLLDSKTGGGVSNLLKPELARGELTVIGATTNDEFRQSIEGDQAISRRFEVVRVNEPDITAAARMITRLIPVYETHHGIKVDPDAVLECVRLAKRYIKDRRLPDAAIDLLDRTMSAIKMMEEVSARELELLRTEYDALIADENNHNLFLDVKWFYRTLKNKLSPILVAQSEEEFEVEKADTPQEVISHLNGMFEKLSKLVTEAKREHVDKHDLSSVIAHKTGIPVGKIQSKEKEKLVNMDDFLRKRVVGQDHALTSIAAAVLESRSGLNKSGQPVGSFFLLGPTGTGKTELAKSIAEFLFNDDKAMIRFDMSEFKEEHSAALLYGAPPGYVGYEEGGMLVNKIREQPYAVVLFDEIEKAHPSVFDIFLQILDEGHMHDRLGKEGDFSNAIILFTSNIGSEWIIEQFGKSIIPKSTDLIEIMSKNFRPEFLARLTEVVPFAPVSEKNIVQIFNIQLKNLVELLDRQGISIEISDEARKKIAMDGFSPRYGARPINGVIRTQLRRPISRMIISGQLGKGSKLIVGLLPDGTIDWKMEKDGILQEINLNAAPQAVVDDLSDNPDDSGNPASHSKIGLGVRKGNKEKS